jgi:hypothetical protein
MKGLLAFLNRWEDEFVNVGVGLMPISWECCMAMDIGIKETILEMKHLRVCVFDRGFPNLIPSSTFGLYSLVFHFWTRYSNFVFGR